MPTTLVSGFGPWGSIDENPTLLVLDRLRAAALPGLRTLSLPVESAAIDRLVADAFDEHRPDVWIGMGLAMGASVVAVERVAVNLRDFSEADVAGARPSGALVVDGGPAAYVATLPGEATLARLRAGGVPARLSNSAGTFLCNQLMYTVLHEIAARGLRTRAGFLHVPAHPALIARRTGLWSEHPSMSIDLTTTAVRIAIEVAVDAPGMA